MSMLPIIFIIIACQFSVYQSIPTEPTETSKPYDCGLRCWLSRIVLKIPNKNVTNSLFILQISNFICENVVIDNLNSSYSPPLSLSLLADGLGISCRGDYVFNMSILNYNDNGTFSFQVRNSEMSTTMVLFNDSNGLASSANITNCTTNLDIEDIEFTGGNSAKILQFVNSTIKELAQKEINIVACNEITSLVNTKVTAALVAVGAKILPYLHPVPPAIPPPVPDGMADLATYPLIALLRYLLNDVVGPNGVNQIVNLFTNKTGSYSIDQIPSYYGFSVRISVPSVGNVTVALLSFGVSGLNTWSVFDLLEPVVREPYCLASKTKLERLILNVSFSVEVDLDGVNSEDKLFEKGRLIANLSKNELHAIALLAMNATTINYLLEDPTEVMGSPLLVAATIYNLNLTQLLFQMQVDHLKVTALEGTVEQEFDTAIDNLLLLFTKGFGSDIPAFWNGYVAGPVRTTANNWFASTLKQFHYQTIPPPTPVPPEWGFDTNGTIIAGIAAAGAFVVICFLLVVCRCCCSSKGEVIMEEISPFLNEKQEQKICSCLGVDDEVPWIARYGIPLAIIGNMALFVSSNLGVGASVIMVVTLGDQKYYMPSLFSFSLSNSIKDMWSAQVYPLSILIAVFSGGWPYLKLLLMLFCWILPSRVLSSKHRENVLMVLDALGKWSLIDAYVLTLMMVAFRIKIVPPVPARMDVVVEPEWGFYSFLLASMLSLVITHLVLAFHRHSRKTLIVGSGMIRDIYDEITSHPKEKEEKPKPLYQHAFPNRFSTVGPTLIVILLITSLGLIGAGSYYDSFQFQFRGAAALTLSYLNETTDQSYSLVSLGLALPNSSSTPDSVGIRSIQATFFLFALAMPASHLLALLALWTAPLRVSVQKKLYVTTEVLNAWSALDVFVIAVIAALLEIEQFAQFIIGDKCDFINQYLRLYFDAALHGNDKCFDVVTELSMGCWLLFGACVAYLISGNIVMRACHRALHRADNMLLN